MATPSLEHVARVIQRFVGVLSDSASVDWSNQKLFVTCLRAGDCMADSMRRQVARKDEVKRKLDQGWGPSSAAVSPLGPVESHGDQTKP